MNPTPTHIELTTEEIVKILEDEAPARVNMSAREMVSAFREGRLECPGEVLDLLGLAAMLDIDHELYVEL